MDSKAGKLYEVEKILTHRKDSFGLVIDFS